MISKILGGELYPPFEIALRNGLKTPSGPLYGTVEFLWRPVLFEGETPSDPRSLSRLRNQIRSFQTVSKRIKLEIELGI